ncbi:MAG: NYN domain-containing protein [Terriglobia bacterium]
MAEERLKLAVFIDFDNIQIGVKDTLSKEFDVSLVLEALKERGEVVTKVAYGDWPRAGEQSRQMTQHAVQMVQRNVTPRGDKNGADINLALDALEMAFNRPHINAFAIVGGDSDFIALVEKLKQYDKRVFVVGGRAFTSNILQRNCHEFITYENLLKGQESSRAPRSARTHSRPSADSRPLSAALENVQRALKILAEREVSPQVGLLKSTLLQLDPTFSERDYGVGSFLEFMQKMERARYVHLRRTERGFLVEPGNGDVEAAVPSAPASPEVAEESAAPPAQEPVAASTPESIASASAALEHLKHALAEAAAKAPGKPLYLRQISQMLRAAGQDYDSRRHGFRGILDLLHQAQREGWLRLHRDRKGVWRIFSATGAPTPGQEPTPAAETVASVEPPAVEFDSGEAEPDVAWDTPGPAEEIPVEELLPTPSPTPLVVEEAAPAEGPSPGRKVRKSRAAKVTKTSARKSLSRRKAKEPVTSDE